MLELGYFQTLTTLGASLAAAGWGLAKWFSLPQEDRTFVRVDPDPKPRRIECWVKPEFATGEQPGGSVRIEGYSRAEFEPKPDEDSPGGFSFKAVIREPEPDIKWDLKTSDDGVIRMETTRYMSREDQLKMVKPRVEPYAPKTSYDYGAESRQDELLKGIPRSTKDLVDELVGRRRAAEDAAFMEKALAYVCSFMEQEEDLAMMGLIVGKNKNYDGLPSIYPANDCGWPDLCIEIAVINRKDCSDKPDGKSLELVLTVKSMLHPFYRGTFETLEEAIEKALEFKEPSEEPEPKHDCDLTQAAEEYVHEASKGEVFKFLCEEFNSTWAETTDYVRYVLEAFARNTGLTCYDSVVDYLIQMVEDADHMHRHDLKWAFDSDGKVPVIYPREGSTWPEMSIRPKFIRHLGSGMSGPSEILELELTILTPIKKFPFMERYRTVYEAINGAVEIAEGIKNPWRGNMNLN